MSEVQFELQGTLNCFNLKWQVVDHVGLKRPFYKLPRLCNLQKWWGFAQSWGPCIPIWYPLTLLTYYSKVSDTQGGLFQGYLGFKEHRFPVICIQIHTIWSNLEKLSIMSQDKQFNIYVSHDPNKKRNGWDSSWRAYVHKNIHIMCQERLKMVYVLNVTVLTNRPARLMIFMKMFESCIENILH